MTFRKVNIRPDASGWTLLAWRGLKVMPRFIAGDAMPLYATFRQGYGVTEDFI